MGNKYSSFRVINVQPDSPAASLHIEPMLDFIIYTPNETNPQSFHSYLSWNEGKEIELIFFNIASQKIWKGKVTPRKASNNDFLGLTLREENYKSAHMKVIHIVNIFPNSPLSKAKFHSLFDYILGTDKETFANIESFTKFIKANNWKAIDLFVYNSKLGNVKTLTLIPDSNWGGSGLLGGEIGSGHIHSLPTRKDKGSEIGMTETDKLLNES